MNKIDIEFRLELLQAINDWQIASSPKRAKKLTAEAKYLPDRFKHTPAPCYRRISLSGGHLIKLGNELKLSEKVSSWTLDLDVAKSFKEGVPESGYQGVVFKYTPSPLNCVLNLNTLYADPAFLDAVESQKLSIKNFDKGIGRYQGTQSETILNIEFLPLSAVLLWGGYSSNVKELASMYYMKSKIADAKLKQFKRLMKKAKLDAGPYWLEGSEAVKRINSKLQFHADRLTSEKTT